MAMEMTPPLQIIRDGPVMHLRLHRPAARNALTATMYDGLRGALAEAAESDGIAVVLLSGAGRDFCAGNDRAGFAAVRDLPLAERPGYQFMRALAAFPKPVVAAVTGRAVGIGATLLLHCDLVYAGFDTRLLLPFARLGLVPEFAASLLLPRMAGHARAAEWLLLGEPMDATAARDIGLVTRILPVDTVLDHARAAAARLADQPADSVRLTRRLMRAPLAERIADTMETEMDMLSARLRDASTARLLAAGGRA